jgi:hypothetical protein
MFLILFTVFRFLGVFLVLFAVVNFKTITSFGIFDVISYGNYENRGLVAVSLDMNVLVLRVSSSWIGVTMSMAVCGFASCKVRGRMEYDSYQK